MTDPNLVLVAILALVGLLGIFGVIALFAFLAHQGGGRRRSRPRPQPDYSEELEALRAEIDELRNHRHTFNPKTGKLAGLWMAGGALIFGGFTLVAHMVTRLTHADPTGLSLVMGHPWDNAWVIVIHVVLVALVGAAIGLFASVHLGRARSSRPNS